MIEYESRTHKSDAPGHRQTRAQANITAWSGVKILFFMVCVLLAAYATGVTEVLV